MCVGAFATYPPPSTHYPPPSLFRQGILLVYDITQEQTFVNVSKWLRNIEEVRDPSPYPSILLSSFNLPTTPHRMQWKM